MKATHIIVGTPKEFAKKVNKLVPKQGVGLRLRKVSYNAGKLAGVVEELAQGVNVSGSLIGVHVSTSKDPADLVTVLAAENPFWQIDSVFPADGEALPVVEGKIAKAAKPAEGNEGAEGAEVVAIAKESPASGVVVVAVLTQP